MESPIYLHNTLTKKKELFSALVRGEVKMYNCGPTVYNYVHIGNLRSNIFADTLRRMFEHNGLKVTQVVNITDVGHLKGDSDEGEDKMTDALKKAGKELSLDALREHADFYTRAFLTDMIKLNIEAPAAMPRASEHIESDLKLIEMLEEKGFAYRTSDGIYFDTDKDKEYGKLGGLNKSGSVETRIKSNPEKKDPRDFALWKFNSELGFDSKWGKGFPGWHLECSAMAMEYLGETFDIHTGGIDHIPVHHNNEIAQSESATGKTFARYWMHNAFININNEKIAKSLGNDIYLKDLEGKGIPPLAYRYYLLGAHYATPMNFNWEALQGASTALKRLITSLSEIPEDGTGVIHQDYRQKFLSYINDDLDTPKAVALVWEILQNENIASSDKKATILDFDKALGLDLSGSLKGMYFKIPEGIASLINDREAARKSKDWKKADEIRKKILEAGYEIKDTDDGPKIHKI